MPEHRPSEPRLSVIVPSCNREAELSRCLAGLAAQTLPRAQLEVLVVDDSGATDTGDPRSSDLGLEHLRFLRHPKNLGAAAARNSGARTAEAPFLAFLDDDCVPEPDWAAEMLASFSRSDGAALAGHVVIAAPEPATDRVTQYLSSPTTADDGSIARAQSANLGVPAAGYAALSGFDERYCQAGYDDYDFCLRWRRQGCAGEDDPSRVGGALAVRHHRGLRHETAHRILSPTPPKSG